MALSKAATLATFERVLREDRRADRALVEELAAQNADVSFSRKP
jgi:hypothetical protein